RGAICDGHLLRMWTPVTRFDPRQIEQLVDDPLHPLGIAENCLRELRTSLSWDVRVLKRLGKTTNDCQRRSQLVRDVGDEISAHVFEFPDGRQVKYSDHRPAVDQRP